MAAKGKQTLPPIDNSEDLKVALQGLASLPLCSTLVNNNNFFARNCLVLHSFFFLFSRNWYIMCVCARARACIVSIFSFYICLEWCRQLKFYGPLKLKTTVYQKRNCSRITPYCALFKSCKVSCFFLFSV